MLSQANTCSNNWPPLIDSFGGLPHNLAVLDMDKDTKAAKDTKEHL